MRFCFAIACLFVLNSCIQPSAQKTPNSLTRMAGGSGGMLLSSEIAFGEQHGCAITSDGVKCWGSWQIVESVPNNLVNPRELVAGTNWFCVNSDNGIHCWGMNPYGTSSIQYPGPTWKNPRHLAAFRHRLCAVTDDGIKCLQTVDEPKVPLLNPRRIALSHDHVCAISDEGVTCWGSDNTYGHLTPPAGLKNPSHLATSYRRSCASTDDGIVCWGVGACTLSLSNPVLDLVASDDGRMCALTSDQKICLMPEYGSGSVATCELAAAEKISGGRAIAINNEFARSYACVASDDGITCEPGGMATNIPSGFENPYLISSDRGGSPCAATDEGIKCWGTAGPIPVLEKPGFKNLKTERIAILATRGEGGCAVTTGDPICWGFGRDFPHFPFDAVPNFKGLKEMKFGHMSMYLITDEGLVSTATFKRDPEILIPAHEHPRQIALGRNRGCVITDSGVQCFGLAKTSEVPPGLRNPDRLSAFEERFCVIEGNRAKYVKCWGGSHLPVPQLDNPTEVAVGLHHVCALTDYGVECWGPQERPVPKDLKNPRGLFAAWDYTCAMTDDGMRCWGASNAAILPTVKLAR